MILVTAVYARKFNAKECELLESCVQLREDYRNRPINPEKDNVSGKPATQLMLRYKDLCKHDTPEALTFRATYEHVLIIHRNQGVYEMTFKDPAVIERIKAETRLRTAQNEASAAEKRLQEARRPLQYIDAAEQAKAAAARELAFAQQELATNHPESDYLKLATLSEPKTQEDEGTFAYAENHSDASEKGALTSPEGVAESEEAIRS